MRWDIADMNWDNSDTSWDMSDRRWDIHVFSVVVANIEVILSPQKSMDKR